MERSYIKSKLIHIILAIVFMIALINIYFYSVIRYLESSEPTVNNIRVETNDILVSVENAIEEGRLDDIEEYRYGYTVVDLKGNILKTTDEEYDKNKKIDIRSDIGYDNAFKSESDNLIKYSTPVINKESQVGTLIIKIPKDIFNGDLYENKILLLYIIPILMVLILFYLLYKIYKSINEDIVIPIVQIHKSTRSILRGNFSNTIKYDYVGEIGEFSHDFEKMRDEFKVSKDREEELKNKEKELLACISHDLKTPISSISGYVEGIRDGVVKDSVGIKRYIEVILKKVAVLNSLIDDILEHSKADLNQLNIDKRECYSGEFFNELFGDLSIDVINKGIDFNVECEIPNVLISIDKGRMVQVIYNIVANSIKYTSKDGVITIRIKNNQNNLLIEIKDNGIGINAEDIPFVFDKFYRSEKSRNLNILGSGLGLSISKYIVEQHGGSIECKSLKDEGTSMYIKLPKC